MQSSRYYRKFKRKPAIVLRSLQEPSGRHDSSHLLLGLVCYSREYLSDGVAICELAKRKSRLRRKNTCANNTLSEPARGLLHHYLPGLLSPLVRIPRTSWGRRLTITVSDHAPQFCIKGIQSHCILIDCYGCSNTHLKWSAKSSFEFVWTLG